MNQIMNGFKWQGNETNESGIATFFSGTDHECKVNFNSFREAHQFSKCVNTEIYNQSKNTILRMKTNLIDLLNNTEHKLSI